MLKGHGDDTYLYEGKIRTNFSSNAYYGVPLDGLFAHLNTLWDRMRTYPEPQAHTAGRELAESLHIRPEETLLTHGATEAIYLTAQTFRDRRSYILSPTFAEYADACRLHGHRTSALYTLDRIPTDADLVWLCNPNNPTGQVIPLTQLEELAARHPSVLFVIDQSYEAFTEERLFTARHAATLPNVILLHSMTKQYGLPGLRIGYLTAHETLTDRIRRQAMPWAVNGMAIEAARWLVRHERELAFDPHYIIKERARVAETLATRGLAEVWPSHTHFLLARLRMGRADALKEYLASTHGMLIRDASNFEGLDARHFRIAVQSPEEDDRLITAIEEWMLL